MTVLWLGLGLVGTGLSLFSMGESVKVIDSGVRTATRYDFARIVFLLALAMIPSLLAGFNYHLVLAVPFGWVIFTTAVEFTIGRIIPERSRS